MAMPSGNSSRIYLVSAVELLTTIDQLDPEARGLSGPNHSWLRTQSYTNDFSGFESWLFNNLCCFFHEKGDT